MQKTKLISLKTGIKNAFGKLFDNTSLGYGIKAYIVGMLLMMVIMLPVGIVTLLLGGILNPSYMPSAESITRQGFGEIVGDPTIEEQVVEAEPTASPETQETPLLTPDGEPYDPSDFIQQMEEMENEIPEATIPSESDWNPEEIADLYNNPDAQGLLSPNPMNELGEPYVTEMPQVKLGPSLAMMALFALVAFMAMAFYSTLFTLIAVKMHNKDFVPMKALLTESLKKAPKFFALTLISSIAIGLGYILLIIPGVILTICFMFAPYILLNENTGVFEALKKSRALVKGYKLALYGRGLLFAIIMLVLIVPLFFFMYAMGQLIMPLFGLFTSLLILEFYDDLKSRQGELAVSGDGGNDTTPTQSEPLLPTEEITAPEAPTELPDLPAPATSEELPDLPEPTKTEELPDLPEPNSSPKLPDLPEPAKPEELPNLPETSVSSVV